MIQGSVRIARSGVFAALAAAGLVAGMPAANAMELTEPGSEIKVNWDNTVRYRIAARTGSQDSAVLNNRNQDDGDRNFSKGIVSNRLELLSELDIVSRQGYGLRLSGQGWYDSIYNQHNDNPGGTQNQTSTNYNEFTSTARRLEGRDFQLRDAFVFSKFNVGDMPTTLRVGQHALVWGESLFFAANGIAGAQSPFDVTRLLADPTAQAKEFVLPVPQVSGQIQLTPDVTLGAYYQFKWVRNTYPAVGSYFSQSDIWGPGAENAWIYNPMAGAYYQTARTADMKPGDSGQGGVQLRWNAFDTDFGLYALRFHDKNAQLITQGRLTNGGVLPWQPGFTSPNFVPVGYYHAYNKGSTAYGFSASHTFGSANFAFEGSLRNNQALASSGAAGQIIAADPFFSSAIQDLNNSDKPAYAVGKTAHANASVLWSLEPGALWREAVFVGEVAWNRMLSCEKGCSALDPHGTRDAWAFRGVFTPTYRQVAPGLDLSVPIGLGYSPKGSRSLALGPGFLPPEDGGDFTIGLAGVYQSDWRINLSYTHYFGPGNSLMTTAQIPTYTYQNTLRDRDFVSLTIRKTF